MESIKTLIDREFQYTQQAAEMIAYGKNWTEAEVFKFSELSHELVKIRQKLVSNPNFHPRGNGLMH